MINFTLQQGVINRGGEEMNNVYKRYIQVKHNRDKPQDDNSPLLKLTFRADYLATMTFSVLTC